MAKESRINPEQYIVLQGWMISDLKLKGNELIIYACIHGFSQAENQVFNGSLQYLADWTNSTRQTVINSIKSLIEKGYIVKTDKIINGVKFCEYQSKNLTGVVKKFDGGSKESCMGGSQKSLPNNIAINNLLNNKEIYIVVLDYLNSKTGQHFRHSTKATQQHINARLAEGFTVEDFKRVVDNMCKEWISTEWEQYLRPSTLFGSKFENYLNRKPQSKGKNGVPVNNKPNDLAGVF